MKAKLCIQCRDETTNEVGSFLAEAKALSNIAISPVFDNCIGLFVWCRENGWVEQPYTLEFPTGLYSK